MESEWDLVSRLGYQNIKMTCLIIQARGLLKRVKAHSDNDWEIARDTWLKKTEKYRDDSEDP